MEERDTGEGWERDLLARAQSGHPKAGKKGGLSPLPELSVGFPWEYPVSPYPKIPNCPRFIFHSLSQQWGQGGAGSASSLCSP